MRAGADIEIGNVRLRTAGDRFSPGRMALRLRVDHLLDTADLRPVGISPSAVLILRALPDPLPGRLAPQRIQARVDRTWERAARQAIADAYRRAYRPASGPVPASADAVLFPDEGEMLAWLAFDLSQGRAPERWWWRAAMRTVEQSPHGLTMLLCRHAMAVPAAMHHLLLHDRIMVVVRYLSSYQSMVVTSAVLGAYGVELAPLLRSDACMPAPAAPAEPGADPNASQQPTARDETSRPRDEVRAIWSRWVPPALRLAAIEKERACLVGIALGLYQEPAVIRGGSFQVRFREWWHAAEGADATGDETVRLREESTHRPQQTESNPLVGALEPEQDGSLEATANSGHSRGDDRVSRDPASIDGVDAQRERLPLSDARPQLARDRDGQSDADVSNDAATRFHGVAGQATSLHPDSSPTDLNEGASSSHAMEARVADDQIAANIASPESRDAQQEPSTLRLEGGFPTQLGGIVYLINLMCRLDLPLCFEEDWRLATTVGPWGTLEMLARSVLERSASELAGDPIWPALAQLDARQAGTLPGADFEGNPCFRLPRSWHSYLTEADTHTYGWAVDGGRARLWSDHGIVLFDDTASPLEPVIHVRNELRRYDEHGRLRRRRFDQAPTAALISPLAEGLNPHLRRWLSLVLPSIRRYLRKLLTLGSTEAFDLEQVLLLGAGQLYVSSTHVDLVLPLDAISIPLRLAGLDRDPGWLPDFGRVIKLHFT